MDPEQQPQPAVDAASAEALFNHPLFRTVIEQTVQYATQASTATAVQMAAAAAGDNNAAARVNLSAPGKPDVFNGDRGVRQWITAYENWAEAANVPAGRLIVYAVALFRRSAQNWWGRVPHAQRPAEWAPFKELLISRFSPRSASATARQQLAALRQTGTTAKYVDRVRELAASIDDLSDAELTDRFMTGLIPNVAAMVEIELSRHAGAPSFEELAQIAERIDGILNRPRGSRRPLGGAANGPRPMEIDVAVVNPKIKKPTYADAVKGFKPLTPEEREELRRKGGCFYCRKIGHVRLACPLRPKGNFKSSGSRRPSVAVVSSEPVSPSASASASESESDHSNT